MSIAKRKAFTLIELLVVIGIIMILASILTPGLMKARKKANKSSCLANVKAIGTAMLLYADDYNNRFPHGNNLEEAFGVMMDTEDFTETKVFKCPESRTMAPDLPASDVGIDPLDVSGNKGIDYLIVSACPNSGSAAEGATASDPSSNLLVVEKFDKGPLDTVWDEGDNHSDGGNCFFINGSAKFLRVPQLNTCYNDHTETYDPFLSVGTYVLEDTP